MHRLTATHLFTKARGHYEKGGLPALGAAIWRKSNPRRLDFLAFSPTRRERLTLTSPAEVTVRESHLHELLSHVAASLPRSTGSHHFAPIRAKLAIITDLFMYNFYKDVFEEVIYLSPHNYRDVLSSCEVDAVLYVTCWRGLHNNDWRHNANTPELFEHLSTIASLARERGVPMLFHSIEDPVSYSHFLPIARLADHVFTSDSDMIERYISDLGHDRVSFGEYGVNPALNNPIGSQRFSFPSAFFAGSFYPKYPERNRDMAVLFDSVLAAHSSHAPHSSATDPASPPSTLGGTAGASSDSAVSGAARLLIADRNYGTDHSIFPKRYQPYATSPFPHELLQQIHKLFAANLSISSVTTSPTMCAMRVYELQACGKLLISNDARAVRENFEYVRILAEREDLSELFTPQGVREADQQAQGALTQIMAQKTSYHVVSRMCQIIGLPEAEHRPQQVLVIARGDLDTVRRDLENQSYPHTLLVSDAATARKQLREGKLPEVGYVTVMDSRYSYGADYLLRRMNAFIYADVRFVSSDTFAPAPRVHEYIDRAANRALTVVSTASSSAVDFIFGEIPELSAPGYAVDTYELSLREGESPQQ